MMGQMGFKMASPDKDQGKMAAMTRMLDDLDLSPAQWKYETNILLEKPKLEQYISAIAVNHSFQCQWQETAAAAMIQ